MPSKSTFALVALLAATSVSALPRGYGYANVYERDLTSTSASQPVPPVAAAAQPAVAPPVQAPLNVNSAITSTTGSGALPHPHHHHPYPSSEMHQGVHHHHADGTGLSGQHPHAHLHPHPHPHPYGHQLQRSQSLPPSFGNAQPPSVAALTGPGPAPAPPSGGLTRRELEYYENLVTRDDQLERRGILEALGLKARVRDLTANQNEKIKEAQKACDNLTTKKDKHTCHYNVDKIINLTKERNHYVDEFLKETGNHNIFTGSDPSPSSASPSSSTSSSTSSSSVRLS